MNILSSMSQWSQASDLPVNASQESATSVEASQNANENTVKEENIQDFFKKDEGEAAPNVAQIQTSARISEGTSEGISGGIPENSVSSNKSGTDNVQRISSIENTNENTNEKVIEKSVEKSSETDAEKTQSPPAASGASGADATAARAIFQPASNEAGAFTRQWLGKSTVYSEKKTIKLLIKGIPNNMKDYAEHLYKVSCLLYDGALSFDQANKLERKFVMMTASLPQYLDEEDPSKSQLYLVVEKCFDLFIKMAMDMAKLEIATHTIRFLTTVMLDLNYWEIYNLLRWRPAIWQFLTLIDFDLHECYARFMRDYRTFAYRQEALETGVLKKAHADLTRKRRGSYAHSSSTEDSDSESYGYGYGDGDGELEGGIAGNPDLDDGAAVLGGPRPKKDPRPRKKAKTDAKSAGLKATARSSNYDPDVVHECQLPAPEDPTKVCLRRFSRKYELIRHQETVHSKKKKLFKCFVCVKQDPTIGPRIFTRHDTLAKHIRVNHRISGKEAKAEVAYSKKHAEIVEEGDITVHVGRRKTKVDFELRAHMEKKGAAREGVDGTVIFDEIDESAPDSIQSGDEGLY